MSDGDARALAQRIVVVEDDEELRALLVSDLTARGWPVQGVASAEALYRHMAVEQCDIVVLDVGLPGEDGYSVARHLRQMSAVGIVMLSGRGAAADTVRGLEAGADFYLSKPVEPDVLAASLGSLCRRLSLAMPPAQSDPVPAQWMLTDDGWSLCPPQGAGIALGRAERAFLQPLFAAPGRPVAREALIASISDTPWDFDPHQLEVLLHRLRSRVRTQVGSALPVRAVRGVGYLYAEDGGTGGA